ncbi:MAG: hypothetical protein NTV22_04985, partial [bacterium]|nr:hypothetical protein [bacterium]
MKSNTYATACDYATLNLSVIPIAPMIAGADSNGASKISKRPALQAGQLKRAFASRADDAALRQWFVEGAHTNLGICCGHVSNIIV